MKDAIHPVKLNMAVTRANLNNDAELIAAIAMVVIEDLPALVSELREAARENDAKQLRLMAHTIKGLASNFHAEPLVTLSQRLEREGDRLAPEKVQELIQEIDEVSHATIAALERRTPVNVTIYWLFSSHQRASRASSSWLSWVTS